MFWKQTVVTQLPESTKNHSRRATPSVCELHLNCKKENVGVDTSDVSEHCGSEEIRTEDRTEHSLAVQRRY
jgi:hypothetical protein